MATVPQKTLNWLWSVLQREYRDPQRTYSDVAQTLALYPSFAPRTDAYTFENGASALLLHLSGTLPVNFRGSQYRFPIAIWIPQAYPYESPIFYVQPTDDMVIRPGQHVSGSDGRIYHPYLARWREAWERSLISDFLKLLADVFAREPPVTSRQQQRQQQQQMPPRPSISSHAQHPPPRPPLPGEQNLATPSPPPVAPGPPPPPPKQVDQSNGSRPASAAPQDQTRPGRYNAPPPLPGQGPPARPPSIASPPRQTNQPQPQLPFQTSFQPSPRENYASQQRSVAPAAHYQQNTPSTTGPSPHTQGYQQPVQSQFSAQQPPPQHALQQPSQPPQQSQFHPAQYHPPQQYPPGQSQPLPLKPKPQQPNLMDESPFDIPLPSSSTTANLPTPDIPPNPEKQHILQTLQSALLTTLQNQVDQSNSALSPLQSQHNALSSAQHSLKQELSQLQTLQAQLQSNVSSLTSTIASADRTIASAQTSSSPDKIPAVDDLIIPPTVVARQLYENVAEQRGYETAIYALTEGFVRGRITGEMWSRKTRECAREEFRRKWLVRRIARGMGLDGS